MVSCLTLRPASIGGVEQMIVDLLGGLTAIDAPFRTVGTRAQVARLVGDGVAGTPMVVRDLLSRFVTEECCPLWPLDEPHDLVFPNGYTPISRPHRTGVTITVIHDVLHHDYPHLVPLVRRRWRSRAIAHSLRSADAVVCISAFTRDRIRHHFGEEHHARLQVVPNPVNLEKFRVAGAVPRRHPRPYILSVANHFEHKNLLTLVDGFQRVAARHPDVDLILVGQLSGALGLTDYSERLRRAIGESDRIVMTGFVSQDELNVLYRDAGLFALPSLYEGFGRPLVEALALGVPVVASDLAVFREIEETAVDFVAEPRDGEAWAATLDTALTSGRAVSAATRDALVARYHPTRIAKNYLDLAKSLR